MKVEPMAGKLALMMVAKSADRLVVQKAASWVALTAGTMGFPSVVRMAARMAARTAETSVVRMAVAKAEKTAVARANTRVAKLVARSAAQMAALKAAPTADPLGDLWAAKLADQTVGR